MPILQTEYRHKSDFCQRSFHVSDVCSYLLLHAVVRNVFAKEKN